MAKSGTSTRKSATAKDLVPVLAVRDAVHFPAVINTLHVARETSSRALRNAMEHDSRVIVLSQRDMAVEEPTAADLVEIGTLSEVLQALPMPDTSMRAVLRGIGRVRVTHLVRRDGMFWAQTEPLEEVPYIGVRAEAMQREAIQRLERIVRLGEDVPPEAMPAVAHVEESGALADAIAHHLPLRPHEKQQILEELGGKERLARVLVCLRREEQVLALRTTIQARVDKEVGDVQREFYLREQLRVIQSELESRGSRQGESERLRERIHASGMAGIALEKALLELDRLDHVPASSPEGVVIRNYLDWLIELPWNTVGKDRLNVNRAATLLDREHYGLTPVKERILDYLAVRQLNRSLRGPILCFVGPPGVGKTSLGRSIAHAMDRPFHRVSLGGIRDEAEIRGHRRTYVGAMPGRIIQGLRQCGVRNPVVMLDEIDKMGTDMRGDPTSALLEALDPEQNGQFRDHFIEAPFNLDAVMFIATANLLEAIPAPLRDRMEIIRFPSYTEDEKVHIAKRFLVPRALERNGLAGVQVTFDEPIPTQLVREYTREAGVRSLERVTDELCRKIARRAASKRLKEFAIGTAEVGDLLGTPPYPVDAAGFIDQVGTATGLVVTEVGGDIVTIEASLLAPLGATPLLHLTGNLGAVMKESAQTAMTYVRSIEDRLGPVCELRHDVHVHVPAASIPKDGPSAGLTIGVVLASALSGIPVRGDVAMTGELTLRGKVMPVGGVRDKVLAAHRAGIRTIILPEGNRGDLAEIPASVQTQCDLRWVATMDEALEIALVGTGIWDRGSGIGEEISRLLE